MIVRNVTNCERARRGKGWLMAAWREDKGPAQAYKIRDYLRQNGQFQSLSIACPLYLEPGERCLVITTTRLSIREVYRNVPEDVTYFRLKYSFAKDPLVAPFMWIILLPFNLLSMMFARAAHPVTTNSSQKPIGQGYLAVTDRALIQGVYGNQFRFPWSEVYSVNLRHSPPGINFQWSGLSYIIEPIAQLELF